MAVSSRGIRFGDVDFDDLHFEHRPYEPFAAYGQSKTANALFAVELDRRGRAQGVRPFAVHPGTIIETGLAKHVSADVVRAAGVLDDHGRPVRDPSRQLKTLEQGAATGVWCATSPQLTAVGGSTARTATSAPWWPRPTRPSGAPERRRRACCRTPCTQRRRPASGRSAKRLTA
ncbi:hypothetical protein [Streptomyces sp. NPDC055013]